MKRDPTIHMMESDLVDLLKDILAEQNAPTRLSARKIVSAMFEKGQKYQIKDRYIINAPARTRNRLKRTVEAENPIVGKFNRVLDAVRRAAGHKGIKVVRPDSSDHLQLREVAKIAYEFSEDFDIRPREDGYKEFCAIGIRMMGRKYSINKFKSYKEKIYQEFKAMVDVVQDDNPEATSEFYYVWRELMIEYANVEYSVDTSEYFKYVYFVDGRKMADQYEADYTDWIKAQFEGLVFLNAIPEFSQFSTEKALDRYEKYMQTVDQEEEEIFTSEDEKKYFDEIKNK